jgi:hypothetical protein
MRFKINFIPIILKKVINNILSYPSHHLFTPQSQVFSKEVFGQLQAGVVVDVVDK